MHNDDTDALTALVIDDNPTILEFLEELVGEAGFVPTCFGRGQPALATLAQQRFDLLLIDLWLPDLNGLEICQAARKWYGAESVVLIITADHRVERWITAFDLGADDCVGKPFEIDELLARIQAKFRRPVGVAA